MTVIPLANVEWTCKLTLSGGLVRFRLAPPAHSAASFPLDDQDNYAVVMVDARAASGLLPERTWFHSWYKETKSARLDDAYHAGEAFYPPLLIARMPGRALISDGQHRIDWLNRHGCDPYPVVVLALEEENLRESLGARSLGLIDVRAKTFRAA